MESPQKVDIQSPTKHLGKDVNSRLLFPTTVFIQINPFVVLVWQLLLRRLQNPKMPSLEKPSQPFNIKSVHATLVPMCKDTSTRKQPRQTQKQMRHDAKPDVLPTNIEIDDYIMVRTHAKGLNKLKLLWGGPLMMTQARSHLLFEAGIIHDRKKFVTHAQRILRTLLRKVVSCHPPN